MDILGIVRTHLTQMVTWLKTHLNATTLKSPLLYLSIGVLTICQKIQSVVTTLLAQIKQSKDQLVVQIQTQVGLLTKHVSIHVHQIRGHLGKLRQKVVSLIPQRVLNLLKKEQ